MTDVGQEGVTLDDLDADPAMLTTWENRRIFRLAKERITELETATRLLEKASKRLGRDVQNALTDYHNAREEAAQLRQEIVALREAHHDA
jgi:hypothetical protein